MYKLYIDTYENKRENIIEIIILNKGIAFADASPRRINNDTLPRQWSFYTTCMFKYNIVMYNLCMESKTVHFSN